MGIVAGEATVLEVAYLRGKARSDRRGPLRWQPDRGHPAPQRPPLGAFRRESCHVTWLTGASCIS